MRLQHENIGKLKNFKNDLLKLGIEYEFKEIALQFRGIPIQLIEKIS
jgi:hypothetical protein